MKFFKDYLLRFFKHRLVVSSLIMIVGTFVANVGSYLYHLLMGRMLGPKAYGELESIISLLYLLTVMATTLTLVMVKFTAYLKGKKDQRGISWLFSYSSRRLVVLGGVIFLFMVTISPFLASFLHLTAVFPLVLVAFVFWLVFIIASHRGILQGLLEFKQLVILCNAETYLKVLVSFLLVLWGFQINGAVAGFLISSLFAYWLVLFFLRKIRQFPLRKPDLNRKTVVKFALPVFLYNLSFTSLYTTDIILIKHFFSAYEAGLYSALSILGKIIYFASSAIPMVMFPMVVNRYSRGKSYSSLLFFSLSLVLLICLGANFIYFLFPKLMVNLLFGQEYLMMAPLVGWMGVFISLYSLAYLLVNFFLSIDQTRAVFFPFAASLVQVVLIWFFHDSLKEVLQVSIGVCSLLLFSLLLYYGYGQAKASFRYRSRL